MLSPSRFLIGGVLCALLIARPGAADELPVMLPELEHVELGMTLQDFHRLYEQV